MSGAQQSETRGRRLALVAVIVLVLVVLDHATKWLAIQYLMGKPPIIYLGDLFRLQYATNTGAFLSLGSGLPESMRGFVLTGLNGLILLAVLLFLVIKRDVPRAVNISLALILAGGVGNILDRIFRGGIVVDFMNLGIPWGPFQIRTGIFNIADLAIMAGLFLMIGVELFGNRAEKSDEAGTSKEAKK